MLNITTENIPDAIRQLIVEFRRSQVSRFPVDVAHSGINRSIHFGDSRFPNKESLARLEVNGLDKNNKKILKMYSFRISNDKFLCTNRDYRTRSTSDPKKMLKWMKDYIKPYTGPEVARMSKDTVADAHRAWQREAEEAAVSINRISERAIYEEIEALLSFGVEFRTEKFRELATVGLPAYKEKRMRSVKAEPKTHVLINPDESVVVSGDADTATYDSLEAAPEQVQQHVALLRMMEQNEYLPDVGIKVNAQVFWVNT